MRQHKNGIQECFSAENFLSHKLSNVFCYDFGRFPLAAREIQNEADTWHCASFNGLRLMKEILPKVFLC